jgi:hypothetical protein
MTGQERLQKNIIESLGQFTEKIADHVDNKIRVPGTILLMDGAWHFIVYIFFHLQRPKRSVASFVSKIKRWASSILRLPTISKYIHSTFK